MNTNMLNSNDNPTWRDAAIIASILTFATYFTVFLTGWTIIAIKADIDIFLFQSIRFIASGWFTQFILMTGLNKLTQKEEH